MGFLVGGVAGYLLGWCFVPADFGWQFFGAVLGAITGNIIGAQGWRFRG